VFAAKPFSSVCFSREREIKVIKRRIGGRDGEGSGAMKGWWRQKRRAAGMAAGKSMKLRCTILSG